MMSTSNVMELITKGGEEQSWYMYDGADTVTETMSGRSSTAHSTRTESQLSLEYLPPEAPYYGSATTSLAIEEDDSDYPLSQESNHKQSTQAHGAAHLYQRIQALTEQIHSELDNMIGTESVNSHQPTPLPDNQQLVREQELGTTMEGHNHLGSSEPRDCHDLVCVSASEDEDGGVFTPGECDSTLTTHSTIGDTPLMNVDPKMRKALDKMRKLDEKLADLDKKEKEVKRQRKLLEQQMEPDGSISSSSTHSLNQEKYPPVFTTQLSDTANAAKDKATSQTKAPPTKEAYVGHSGETDEGKPKPKTHTDQIAGTNFIKRNIELASDAGAVMTEAEKQRLEELMGGEEFEEDPSENRLQLCVEDAQELGGFTLRQEDMDRMRTIDSQLQAILPPSDWESISCSSRMNTQSPPDLNREPGDTSSETVDTADHEEEERQEGEMDKGRHIAVVPGEEVLHQFQMSRTERERLKSIDEQLRAIQTENQLTLPLAKSELQALLDQCQQLQDEDSGRKLVANQVS